MNKPEYTLKQAISIYEMASEQYQDHIRECKQCIGWFATGPHCEEGHRLMLINNKWIRRMRRAMQLEGKHITLPTLISERVR